MELGHALVTLQKSQLLSTYFHIPVCKTTLGIHLFNVFFLYEFIPHAFKKPRTVPMHCIHHLSTLPPCTPGSCALVVAPARHACRLYDADHVSPTQLTHELFSTHQRLKKNASVCLPSILVQLQCWDTFRDHHLWLTTSQHNHTKLTCECHIKLDIFVPTKHFHFMQCTKCSSILPATSCANKVPSLLNSQVSPLLLIST